MRIYLANIGTNSNHRGLFSPLFADGRFELFADSRRRNGIKWGI